MKYFFIYALVHVFPNNSIQILETNLTYHACIQKVTEVTSCIATREILGA